MPFKRTTGKGDSLYTYHKCVIALDQSYTRTGLSIAVQGQLKIVKSINFKYVKTKTAKRRQLAHFLSKAIESCLTKFDSLEIAVIHERIRTITSGTSFRPDVIKAASAMQAYIVDTAFDYGLKAWSVDTRAWKAAVLGTSRPSFEPIKGVTNPQKFGAVRKVIELGFESSIARYAHRNTSPTYDDDAAESACIALYPFVTKNILLKREL